MRKFWWFLWAAGFVQADLLSTEEVLWWWDDGLIDETQAGEFLALIDIEDTQAICELREAYLGEPCEHEKKPPARKKLRQKAAWKTSLDSSGGFYAQRFGVDFEYRNYRLKVLWKGEQELNWKSPSQFTFAYREKKAEALWGTLRYQDLKMHIPVEPVFGSAFHLNPGMFQTGAWLGADSSFGGTLGISKAKLQVRLFGNYHAGKTYFAAQTSHSWGRAAVWWNPEMKTPLFFLLLRFREPERFFSLHGQFYYHENDSLPPPLKLPKTVAKNKLWSAQRQSIQIKHIQISLLERTCLPPDTGKAKMETGIEIRGKRKHAAFLQEFLCRDAAGECGKPRIRTEAGLAVTGRDSLYGRIRLQGDSFRDLYHIPRLLCGAKHQIHERVYVKEEWITAENKKSGTPWTFRQEAGLRFSHGAAALRYDIHVTRSWKIAPHRLGFTLEAVW